MPHDRPQYYRNDLQPINIDRGALLGTLKQLRTAVLRGVDLIQAGEPPTNCWDSGGMFNSIPGIALAFLRLQLQAQSLTDKDKSLLPDFFDLAKQRIPFQGPYNSLNGARLSPVGSSSSATAAILRILAAATEEDGESAIFRSDITCLGQAVNIALGNPPMVSYKGRTMGGDEVLYGRCGLLWAILYSRTHVYDREAVNSLLPIFEAVPMLVDVIVDAGRQGSNAYIQKYGEESALPLMWTWMEGRYGLGAVHGITGILTVLLGCRKEELDGRRSSYDYFPFIADTVTGLCKLCIANRGHLPTSIPVRPSSRPSPLVQICHGSPSLLVLLACARSDDRLSSDYWQPEWDEAIRLATERVWEEGLLSKGGGLCHGITGNAWPMLMLHSCFEYGKERNEKAERNYRDRIGMTKTPKVDYGLTGDYFLSRALAFLLHAQETRPYNSSHRSYSKNYRLPDSPFSLFEGLAGTVCAWAEACPTIQMRLRKMELEENDASSFNKEDEIFTALSLRQLGFPGLGGHGSSVLS